MNRIGPLLVPMLVLAAGCTARTTAGSPGPVPVPVAACTGLTAPPTPGPAATGPAATGPTATGPAAAGSAAAAGPAVTGTAAAGPAVTGTAAAGPAVTGTAAAGPAVTGTAVTGTAVTGTAVTGTAAAGPAATGNAGTDSAGTDGAGTGSAGTATGVGRRLPDLTLACLGGGTELRLTALRGPAVVNLWASWCAPCRKELPALQRFAGLAAGKVHVLGVVTGDDPATAAELAVDLQVSFASVDDPQRRVLRELAAPGLPVTALVDADGTVRHVHRSSALDEAGLTALVRRHLAVSVGR